MKPSNTTARIDRSSGRKATLADGVALHVTAYSTPANEPRLSGVRFDTSWTTTPEKLADVLVAAFEGGSNYWCQGAKQVVASKHNLHSDHLAAGGDLDVFEEDGGPHRLTLEKFAVGIAKAAAHKGLGIPQFIDGHDALDADLALQFALFDEIVYG